MAELIGERFEVVELAGAGGMGKVYSARDRVTGERVAVKVLRSEGLEEDRFEREGAVLATLRHPGIVRYVAHGRAAGGSLYLAMEWLEGEDLSQRLKRRELSFEETLTLGRRVGEALDEAHEAGVVHRDVKPGNIFLVDRSVDRLKVLDFGVARVANAKALTHTGFMIGTPGYMAPEQTRGEKGIDARADVFSLGCVLFRCLTGRAPFVDDDLLAILLKVTLEEAPRVRSLRADVPEAIDDLVDRMLAKAKEARPRDGGAVAAEIAGLSAVAIGGKRHLSAPPPFVTETEQRLLCVLLARAGDDAPTRIDPPGRSPGHPSAHPGFDADADDAGSLSSEAERYGGKLHVLVDGSLYVTVGGSDAAMDQAVRAARCALAFRKILPGVPMVLVAGRAVLSGCVPLGDAIDRGVKMLARGSADEVRLDDVIAGLLDTRFEVRRDETGCFLRRERDMAEATRPLLGKPTACVGRESEIVRLGSFLEECVTESTARAVLVTAPAGAGKSRLRHEFWKRVRHERPDVAIWMGRGDLMSARSPFSLMASLIRSASGAATHAARREAARVAELLGEIVALPASDSRAGLRAARSDGQPLGDQMRCAWLDWLRAEASARPVLIVLEDVHWGDLVSLGLVDAALRELADLPILVLALARPDVHEVFPKLWADRAFAEVKLGALSRKASQALVRQMLGDAPASVVEAIVARGAGNAFYLEELIRAVAEGKGDTLPETVLAMAEHRLSRLDPEARRVLRAASVFGELFWTRGVTALLGATDAGRCSDWLADLASREVVERRGEARFRGEEAYAFRHALVRDAAYAMLTEDDRTAAHARAGAFLEEVGEHDAVVLAEHFERGGEPARARRWYARAAEQAFEGNDLEGAIALAERAITRGASGAALAALRLIQGEAHAWRGEPQEAKRRGEDALAIAPKGSALWCRAAGGMVMVHVQLGRMDQFAALARELVEVDPEPEAVGRYVGGGAVVVAYLYTGGLYELGRTFLARMEGAALPAALADPVAMGWLDWARGCRIKYETANPWRHLEVIRAAAASFRESSDLRGSIRIALELCVAMRNLGRFDEAERIVREAHAGARRLGAHFLVASAEGHLAAVSLALGRVGEARSHAENAIDAFTRSDNQMLASFAKVTLALVALEASDLDGALAAATGAVDRLVAPPWRASGLGVLARVSLARGDGAAALRAAEEGIGLLRALGSIPEGEALLRLTHAEALLAAGRRGEARTAIEAARARLMERAAGIEEGALRRGFLGDVAVNRLTLEAAETWKP